MTTKKPSIAELEALLDAEEETPIEILPNGEIRPVGSKTDLGQRKPLTMREDLGGEYAMDVVRINSEAKVALRSFAYVEVHPTTAGEVFLKVCLQTTVGGLYFARVDFDGYPNQMPRVTIEKPSLMANTPHRYNTGAICYLHPNMWNPGSHDVTFVVARIAKWLNKYEVWRSLGSWPGAQVKH